MSIKLVKKKFQQGIDFQLARCDSYAYRRYGGEDLYIEGDYVVMKQLKTNARYPAFVKSFPIVYTLNMMNNIVEKIDGLEANKVFHAFFNEPSYIGNFGEYQGLRIVGTTYEFLTRTTGVATSTEITLDLTTEHEIGIVASDTECRLYIDGALETTHTTNISTALPRWYATEIGHAPAYVPFTYDSYIYIRRRPNIIDCVAIA